jgi:hypothetical protein
VSGRSKNASLMGRTYVFFLAYQLFFLQAGENKMFFSPYFRVYRALSLLGTVFCYSQVVCRIMIFRLLPSFTFVPCDLKKIGALLLASTYRKAVFTVFQVKYG